MSEENITDIIGFDLGHGDTALAWGALSTPSPPEMLEIDHRDRQVTAIAYDKNGRVIVGERAWQTPRTTKFQVSFKARPKEGRSYKKTMLAFVDAIHAHLVETAQIRSAYCHYFIGCPSGWSIEDQEKYQLLMETSNIPRVVVVRESRAALMNAKEAGRISVERLQQPTLVIDMGSSTTDLTQITISKEGSRREQSPVDFGYDLGAALIDKAILDYSIDQHERSRDLKAALRKNEHYRNMCELRCRQAKEEYYSNPSLYQEVPVYVAGVTIPTKKRLVFQSIVSASIMDRILAWPMSELDGRSWKQTFRDVLVEARNILNDRGILPGALLLTGGASRMDFVQPICQGIFPPSGCEYIRDKKPEFSIAKGLVTWGRIDINTTRFMDRVDNFLAARLPDIVEKRINDLHKLLVNKLVDSLVDVALMPILEAKKKNASVSREDLESRARRDCDKWLKGESAKRAVSKAVVEWVEKVEQEDLELPMTDIYHAYGLSYEALRAQVKYRPQVNRLPVSLKGVINVEEAVGVAATTLGASVLGALLIGGPIGWVVAGIGFLLSTGIASESSLTDEKIKKIVTDQRVQLSSSIRVQMKNDQEAQKRLVRDMNQSFKFILRERADKARELIA